MAHVCFKIDVEVNFYFYLMNLYAYDLEEVDLDFRKKYSHLRSKDFFKVFEKLENPFLKTDLGLASLSGEERQLLDHERVKFLKIWSEYESGANSLKSQLESSVSHLDSLLEKIFSLIDCKSSFDSFVIQIVPFLKPHGKQECSNVLYLSKKDELSSGDYMFIIVHEILHLVLYDLMADFYFRYGYTETLHRIEEVMINFIYFEAVKDELASCSLLPRWLYLNDGETYETFTKLVPLQSLIKQSLSGFIEAAIDLLGVDLD